MEEEIEKSEEETLNEKIKKQIDNALEGVFKAGLQAGNIDYFCKLLELKKEDNMRYNNYGRYDYDRYYDDYGRRDSRGRYANSRIDDMYMHYDEYSRGRDEYNRGNYGAKDSTLKSLEYMLESMVDFVGMLKKEATSQEEMELIRYYTHKISEM